MREDWTWEITKFSIEISLAKPNKIQIFRKISTSIFHQTFPKIMFVQWKVNISYTDLRFSIHQTSLFENSRKKCWRFLRIFLFTGTGIFQPELSWEDKCFMRLWWKKRMKWHLFPKDSLPKDTTVGHHRHHTRLRFVFFLLFSFFIFYFYFFVGLGGPTRLIIDKLSVRVIWLI